MSKEFSISSCLFTPWWPQLHSSHNQWPQVSSIYFIRFLWVYPKIVMGDVEVGELGEELVRRQRPFDAKLDLATVGLEAVANLEADPANNHSDQVLNLLKVKEAFKHAFIECDLSLGRVLNFENRIQFKLLIVIASSQHRKYLPTGAFIIEPILWQSCLNNWTVFDPSLG